MIQATDQFEELPVLEKFLFNNNINCNIKSYSLYLFAVDAVTVAVSLLSLSLRCSLGIRRKVRWHRIVFFEQRSLLVGGE